MHELRAYVESQLNSLIKSKLARSDTSPGVYEPLRAKSDAKRIHSSPDI